MSRRPPLSRAVQDAVIDGFTHGGEGVARIEGKAVFAPGTIPGERVRLRVTDDRARWARAEVVEVVESSPDRVVPPCPLVPECGGCDLQHIAPEAQRRLKTRVVVEQLQRLARLEDPPVDACRAVGPDTGYRTHARFHADADGRLGFHRAGTNEVVAVEDCLVLTPQAQALRHAVGDDTGAVEVAVRAHQTGTAAAVLSPGPGPLHLPDGDFDLRLTQPDGSTVGMRGEGVLAEEVGAHTYRYPADGFFQVSPQGAAALVTEVLAAAGPLDGALTYDLYAGAGLLSVPLAAAGAEVVAVEGHAGAADWATRNAEDAGVTLRVLAEPVADVLRRVGGEDLALEPPDLVVLDPPRAGAGNTVIDRIAALEVPQVVYVACDVAALARDTATLVGHGYRLVRAQPLDLFPMTHHVEVVASFVR